MTEYYDIAFEFPLGVALKLVLDELARLHALVDLNLDTLEIGDTEGYVEGQCLVVGLLPVRTDTRWWSDHVMRADEIRFLTGRVRFGGSSSGAPFGSAVAVWGCGHVPTVRQWDWRSGE